MRTRPPILAAVVLAAATTFVRPIHAAQPGAACDVSPASRGTRIEALYKEGVTAVEAGHWPRAYDCFLAARAIERRDQIEAQLARAELKVGRYRDATERLTSLLHESDRLSDEDRAFLKQMLAEAQAKIATLTILVNREGAEVLVDGVAVGASPMSQDVLVDPGLRTIEARLPGEDPQKVVVRLRAGQSRQVGLRFGVPAPDLGPREVAAAPDDPAASRRRRKMIVAAGVSTGAAALTVGIATTILSFVKASERVSACGDPPQCEQSVLDGFEKPRTTLADVAVVSFVGAGLVLGGTAGYAVLTAEQSLGLGVAIKLHPGHAAVSASGTW